MPTPAVKGYMPLCVTPRSQVCDEQGIGQWPMWKRYDSIKGIVNQNIDEQYRNFLAMPYHEIDKLKAEELFYWFTPRCETIYTRLSRTGDDHDYYKDILDQTLKHYESIVDKLKKNGKLEESNFLQLSLKYAGKSEDNVYCGDGHVVATVWGMCPRQESGHSASKISTELLPDVEMHTVKFELGNLGTADRPTVLKKSHGSMVLAKQVPQVSVKTGYECIGWDKEPEGVEVLNDLVFTALYKEHSTSNQKDDIKDPEREKPITDISKNKCHVRFLTPDNLVIKEVDIEQGMHIMPGDVPQLPIVDGIVCPSWDGDPLNDIINANRDYKAVLPQKPEMPTHAVRFLDPEGKVISQTKVAHGATIPSTMIPPLPVVEGKVCPAWSPDPKEAIINSDCDFVAEKPHTDGGGGDQEEHTVRFLNDTGEELTHTRVPHGGYLREDQIPPLPVDGEKKTTKWSPDPTKHAITHDTDFEVRKGSKWHWPWSWGRKSGRTSWRWLFYIILFLLLVFLVLYIMYRINPCSK